MLKTVTSCSQIQLPLVLKLMVYPLNFPQDWSVMLLLLEQKKLSCSRSDPKFSHVYNEIRHLQVLWVENKEWYSWNINTAGNTQLPTHAPYFLTAWCVISAMLYVLSNQMAVKNPAGFCAISIWGIAFLFCELCFLGCSSVSSGSYVLFQCRVLCVTSLKTNVESLSTICWEEFFWLEYMLG